METKEEALEESGMKFDTDLEFFMLTVNGLEKYAKEEIEQLLHPLSTRIVPGIIITRFKLNSISVLSVLLKKMRSLRSVSKIVFKIDELHDLPLQQIEIEKYLNEKVIKITNERRSKYETGYECWKCNMHCLETIDENKLYINNISIPLKTRNRFKKEISKLKKDQFKGGTNDKFHSDNINILSPGYRSTCVRKGRHQYNSLLIEKEIAAPFHNILHFKVNLKYYDIELFVIIVDRMMLYGVSIISDLHLRSRVTTSYSTILNNNICFLIGSIADIKENMVVFDPLCGLGSLVIECKLAFQKYKHVKYIASDINGKAIKQAIMNAKYCNLNVNTNDDFKVDFDDCDVIEFFKWDFCQLTEKEIKNGIIDIVLSDLPFGHKCGTHKKNRKIYPLILETINRILKSNGKALLLTMERKLLAKLLDIHNKQWKYYTLQIDIGGFDALLFVINKIANYDSQKKERKRSFSDNNHLPNSKRQKLPRNNDSANIK